MGKTISLKLTSEEEELLNTMREIGVSPSMLLRKALQHYIKIGEKDFESACKQVNQEADSTQQEEVYFDTDEVNQVDQEVNLLRREVNQSSEKVNLLRSEVNPSRNEVNLLRREVNQPEDKFLSLYIEQLNSRIKQLDNEIQESRNKDAAELQYLKDLYSSLQTEYVNQTKDSIKRLDDKFDRLMFYLEESRRTLDTLPHTKKEQDTNVEDILSAKKHHEKQKKGWVFQMYRM